ncbi:MAG: putative bifunctional diguanylate cyclase/phosphodiesterase [Vicinamibacterales bacterium]
MSTNRHEPDETAIEQTLYDPAQVSDTLGTLAVPVTPFSLDEPTLEAYKAFSEDPTLYAIPVVDDDGRPRGLLNRFKFLEALSRPFGRDLFQHQSVRAAMDPAPLVVDEHVPLEQLSTIVVDDTAKYVFDGFIVTREGRYLGIGTGYSLIRCLTERRQAALFQLAHYDALTGLPNRHLFDDRLGQAIARSQRSGTLLGVLFVDVDRFKAVNDNLGHALGDLLLSAIAQRLTAHVRAQDTVARLSGDEFAVILSDLGSPADAEHVTRELLAGFREPHVLEGREINVSCSIGLALFPLDAMNATSLLRAADQASYHAKQFRNTWQRFSDDSDVLTSEPPLAFACVQRAITERQIEVVYQPQIWAGSRTLHGVEALVRWRDPVRGLMNTSEFVRLAEDAGLIGAVTEYVIDSAMQQVLRWEREGLANELSLAVNISGVEFASDNLVTTIKRHLHQHGFRPSFLELEITESTAMHARAAAQILRQLKTLGIRLSIDDFGTGYSSLSRLHRLPIDGLKIDRSFIEGIETGESGTLIEAIVLMAHSLGLIVTGEGVETDGQRTFLEERGCDRLQGFLFCRPLPPEDLGNFLRTLA